MVALAALHTRPWVCHGERALPGGAAADDGSGGLVEAGHRVFAEGGAFAAWVGHALPAAVRPGDRAGLAIPADDAVFVAVLGGAVVARVGDAVGALQRAGLPGDGAGVFGPGAHTEGLAVVPLGGLVEAWIRDREFPVRGQGFTGHRAHGVGPLVHAHEAVSVRRHDEEVAQVAAVHGQPVEAAPVAAGFDECEAHPGFPLQARHAVHRPGDV